MIVLGKLFLEEVTEIEQWADTNQSCSQFLLLKKKIPETQMASCQVLWDGSEIWMEVHEGWSTGYLHVIFLCEFETVHGQGSSKT